MPTTIHSARELPAGMEKSEAEWCLLCLMESGTATYETTTAEDGSLLFRCTSDKREERWRRNGGKRHA
jgi:hypothetical protein